ncbi:arginyl-tRNA synthetase [Salmonella enterica subsp. enterica]|uniref:Arginyl-tRNA synthetase n=1 Tax=Salmonella enterica I TaxID=59201 RepID=A0A447U1C0_SALET|nr:arginyl-tRNA synthetase [Salmonella enterica subsp. enterica]
MPIRVCCLFFRKADIDEQALASAPVIISEDREAQLAARLLQFEETLTVVAREGTPHVMCAYLYDVAGLFLRLLRALPYSQRRE